MTTAQCLRQLGDIHRILRAHSVSSIHAFHFSTALSAFLSVKLRMSLVELFSVGSVASARYPIANSVSTSEADSEADQNQVQKILLDEAKHLNKVRR